MDYLFEDDDANNQQEANRDSVKKFVCEFCRGTDSYPEADGTLVCSNCHTQSQHLTQQEDTPMDLEDVMNVAAKTKTGNIQRRAKGGRSGVRKKRGRQPLEELNTSRPLPDLTVCVLGFQSVLRGSTKRMGEILELKDDELQSVWESVKSVWMGYVLAWRDGAEKYGSLYPDLRFSLRDMFLNSSYLLKLSRVLSYRVAETLRQQLEDSNTTRTENLDPIIKEINSDSDSESDSDSNSESGGSSVEDRIKRTTQQSIPISGQKIPQPGGQASKRKRPRSVQQLIDQLRFNIKGREEAALSLRPSMSLAAAIIFLAISRIGITAGQIVDWISNGSLPLLNAFDRFLTAEDRENLQSIRSFFGMPSLPKADTIEDLASKLAVANGITSTTQLPQYSDSEDDDEGEPKLVERIRFVPLDCVPTMIAKLVANLGFCQKVMDIAMALIGQPPAIPSTSALPPQLENADKWLPLPLQRAHPKRIKTTEYALAVIVVACKMCPGWETWTYGPPDSKAERNGVEETEAEEQLTRDPKCRGFIPWNEGQFKLFREQHVSDYLDFYEDTMLDKGVRKGYVRPFPALSDLLDKACNTQKLKTKNSKNEMPKMLPTSNKGKQQSGEEANLPRNPPGFSPYIYYPNKLSHTKHTPNQDEVNLTAEPFHHYYTRLVEYIAYRSHAPPHKIHAIVADLDEEVIARCGKKRKFRDMEQERMQRDRRRRAKRRRVEPEMPLSFDQSKQGSAKEEDGGSDEDGFAVI